MTKFASIICLAICGVAFCSATWADTYRWVDDSGVVNYSELKPRDVAPEKITKVDGTGRRVRNSERAAASTAPTGLASPVGGSTSGGDATLSPGQQDLLRDLEDAEAARQDEIAKVRQDNCERSRRVLANLSARDRIRVRDANGKERVLPEEERQKGISDAQQGIVENCNA